jgi:hypothetical protein
MSTASGPTGFNPQYPSQPVTVGQSETLAIVNATKTVSITTPTVNALIDISGYISMTAAATASLNIQVTWTDENSTVHTTQNVATSSDGAVEVVTALTTTGFRSFHKTIRAKASTTLSVLVAGTVTSVTYDFGFVVTQMGTL